MNVCRHCRREVRPMKALAKDHPNTIRQAIPGVCSSCYKRWGRGKPKTARDDGQLEATRASLAAYLKWRKPYRLKAGNP